MDPDDLAYRKSVRNMAAVLAAIVITVFAAILVPPYLAPSHDVFEGSVTLPSPFGFNMHLTLNSTSVDPGGAVGNTGWINSTSNSIVNVTAADSWAFSQGRLWQRPCTAGWPIGVGVMKGHYTQDNYSLGSLLPLNQPAYACPVTFPPQYFLLYPQSSKALASIGGSPALWVLQTGVSFSGRSLLPGASGPLAPGVYTAVLADEWGAVLTANFLVS